MQVISNTLELNVSIDVFKSLPIQVPSIRCSCTGSCGQNESLSTLFPHIHSPLTETVTPAHYSGIMESLGNLYRPTPLRPVPRSKL